MCKALIDRCGRNRCPYAGSGDNWEKCSPTYDRNDGCCVRL